MKKKPPKQFAKQTALSSQKKRSPHSAPRMSSRSESRSSLFLNAFFMLPMIVVSLILFAGSSVMASRIYVNSNNPLDLLELVQFSEIEKLFESPASDDPLNVSAEIANSNDVAIPDGGEPEWIEDFSDSLNSSNSSNRRRACQH